MCSSDLHLQSRKKAHPQSNDGKNRHKTAKAGSDFPECSFSHFPHALISHTAFPSLSPACHSCPAAFAAYLFPHQPCETIGPPDPSASDTADARNHHSISATSTISRFNTMSATVPLFTVMIRSAMAVSAWLWVMTITVLPISRQVLCSNFSTALPVL